MLAEKSLVESLIAKRWTLTIDRGHILGTLQGKELGPYGMLLLLGPKNRFGVIYFQKG
jgi:hypothetical protein